VDSLEINIPEVMVLFINRRVCHSYVYQIPVPWPRYRKFLIVNSYHLKQVNELNINYSKNNEMIFSRNFMPPFDTHMQYTWSVYNSMTLLLVPTALHSRQCNKQEVQACQQHTKYNNKSRHTAQAYYYYYWHKQEEELHEAQTGNHSVCTWFSEKEKNKGLVALSETE